MRDTGEVTFTVKSWMDFSVAALAETEAKERDFNENPERIGDKAAKPSRKNIDFEEPRFDDSRKAKAELELNCSFAVAKLCKGAENTEANAMEAIIAAREN